MDADKVNLFCHSERSRGICFFAQIKTDSSATLEMTIHLIGVYSKGYCF